MELGAANIQVLWFVLGVAVLIFTFLLVIARQEKNAKAKGEVMVLSYDKAKSLAYEMIRQRYAGHRGYYQSYQREFDFKLSLGTLRKALQPTNPTPNTRYVQRVLDDLAPGKYKVLPIHADAESEVA